VWPGSAPASAAIARCFAEVCPRRVEEALPNSGLIDARLRRFAAQCDAGSRERCGRCQPGRVNAPRLSLHELEGHVQSGSDASIAFAARHDQAA
jgi:hypothetical protein